MARRGPRPPLHPTPTSARRAAEFPAADIDTEFADWLGERLRRLALGLAVALVTLRPCWPSEPDLKAEGGNGLGWVLAVVLAAGLALASSLVGGRLRIRFTWNDAAVIALMLLVGMSSTRALDHRTAVNLAWEWGAVGFAYLLLRNLPRSRGESSTIALALVLTASAVAAYGLYQVGVELEEIRALYRAHPKETLLKLGITPGTPAQTAFENRLLRSNEPWSTFALANSLAGFLVGPLVLLLAVTWDNLTRRDEPGLKERQPSKGGALALAAPVLLLLLVCLIATKSRSAYVGLAVGTAVVLVRTWRRVRARTLALTAGLGLAVVGLLVVVGLATGRLDRQVLTESPKSLTYRLEYWTGTWRLITDRPGVFWRGVGPGNFGWAYVRYKLPHSSEEIHDPHNLFLEAWATAGVGAALALVAALALAFANLFGPSGPPARDPDVRDSPGPPLPSSVADAPPQRTGWLLLVAAAALGGLVFWSLVILFEIDLLMRWAVMGAAWLLALECVRMLWRRRPIAAWGLGAGALSVTMNLLAAGGIGIPGVSVMLWALIALGLNLRDDRPCGRLRDAGGRVPAFFLAMVWVALAGLFAGNALTYWRTERELATADAALHARPPDYVRARTAYLTAVSNDKSSARPWLGLAAMEYQAWRDRGALPQDRRWQTIPITMYMAVDPRSPRNPNAWTLHRERALVSRQLLDLIGGSLGPKDVLRLKGNIVEASRTAVLLYPTNAALHALLADASADIGMMADAAREAEEALRLDRLTPHVDKKLPDDVRRHLEARLPEWNRAARSS